jgi:radical SAM superfamily enzyme YgiQ (UPF0313 family)
MFIVKLFRLLKSELFQKELQLLNADYYVFNEIGEQPLIDILKYEQSSETDIQKISNIAYKAGNGYVVNSYETNDIDTSISNWKLSKNAKWAFMRTSISCLFNCKFCSYPAIAEKYKSKSIEVIKRELETISKAGIEYIRFQDDTFNFPKRHFFDVLNNLYEKNYGFKWVAYIRCQYLDDKTVRLMKKTGCIGVFLGLESGNDTILKNMNKRASVDEYLEGISFLHKYNIPMYGAFIVGFPGETDQTIDDTIAFIKKTNLQYYRLFLWGYNPIAPIVHDKEKYLIATTPEGWSHSTMTSQEALQKCQYISESVDTSVHCTIPFDNVFYLNQNSEINLPFNNCLKRFNERNSG